MPDQLHGDPDAIPDLTYEEFKEFHRRYYHPSNSRIFLYGDGDTREYLKFLQENYLKSFKRMVRGVALGRAIYTSSTSNF